MGVGLFFGETRIPSSLFFFIVTFEETVFDKLFNYLI